MNSRLTICHGRIVLPRGILEDGSIVIEDGLIRDILSERGRTESQGRVFDAGGQIIGPGYVDPHCHGDGKRRFIDDPNVVVTNLLKAGTTSVLATIGYPDIVPDALEQQLRSLSIALEGRARTVVMGVHLEGPYINRKYGAQTTRGVIKDPQPAEYVPLIGAHGNFIKWWTCAPERPDALEFIAYAAAHGAIVSAGHSEASADQIEQAIKHGLKVITHWSNATGNPAAAAYKGTRHPGIDEAALVFDELSAEIIPDSGGRHVHPLMAKLLYKAKGPERILVITDAGYERADDPTDPALAALDVSIDSDGNLAGSRLTMAGAARNFHSFSGCTLPELFRMTSLNTARLLKLDAQIGSIELGKLANLNVLDQSLRVTQTFWRGQEVGR